MALCNARVDGQSVLVAVGLDAYPQPDPRTFVVAAEILDWSSAEYPRAWSIQWTGQVAQFVAPGGPVTLAVAESVALDRDGSPARLRITWNTGGYRQSLDVDVRAGGTLQLPPVTRVTAELLLPTGDGINGGVVLAVGASPTGQALDVIDTRVSVARISVAASWDPGASHRPITSATLTQWCDLDNRGGVDDSTVFPRPAFARNVTIYVSEQPTPEQETPVLGLLATARWVVFDDGTLGARMLGTQAPLWESCVIPGHAVGVWLYPEPEATPRVALTWELSL